MTQLYYETLTSRAVFTVGGADAIIFLQGLLTNDVKKLKAHQAIYSLMLTPQGKFLYDFHLAMNDNADTIFLDCDLIKYEEICAKFSMYKLRSDIEINKIKDEYTILVVYGNKIFQPLKDSNTIVFLDLRNPLLGYRVIIKKNMIDEFIYNNKLASGKNYNSIIYDLVIPEANVDLISDKSFPMEFGLDNLNAISFEKGCYVGQELTARTKYRGVVRKKLYKISADSDLNNIQYGTSIMINNIKIGIFCSAFGTMGKALIREEDYNRLRSGNKPIKLNENEIRLEPQK